MLNEIQWDKINHISVKFNKVDIERFNGDVELKKV